MNLNGGKQRIMSETIFTLSRRGAAPRIMKEKERRKTVGSVGSCWFLVEFLKVSHACN
jgi:hypothetical protein